MTFTDNTKIFPPAFDNSGVFDENRLDPSKFSMSCYGYLYDYEYFLDKTPDSIKFGPTPYHRWSIQPCNGLDYSNLELLILRAQEELQSSYSFDRTPESAVLGRHGEILFRHEYDHCFFNRKSDTMPATPEDLHNRIVQVKFNLQNDKSGKIRASVSGLEVMPKDYIYTPPDMIPEAYDESSVIDDGW